MTEPGLSASSNLPRFRSSFPPRNPIAAARAKAFGPLGDRLFGSVAVRMFHCGPVMPAMLAQMVRMFPKWLAMEKKSQMRVSSSLPASSEGKPEMEIVGGLGFSCDFFLAILVRRSVKL